MKQRDPIGTIADEIFRRALATEVAALAHEIQERDGCSDNEAIDRAMEEYDRLVFEARRQENQLRDAREKKRKEDALRAAGKPTLKVSLGDMLKVKSAK